MLLPRTHDLRFCFSFFCFSDLSRFAIRSNINYRSQRPTSARLAIPVDGLWRRRLCNMADDRGPELATALIIFLITCTITVSLRCYTMGVILKRFYVEDYLAVLALVRCRPLPFQFPASTKDG